MKEDNKLQALLKSRRFWFAVAGVAVVVGNDYFGLNLDQEQLTVMAVVVASWIIGDSIAKTK